MAETFSWITEAYSLGPTFFIAFLIGAVIGKVYLKSVYIALAFGFCFGFLAIMLF
jgi:hypothetical protein